MRISKSPVALGYALGDTRLALQLSVLVLRYLLDIPSLPFNLPAFILDMGSKQQKSRPDLLGAAIITVKYVLY